MDDAAVESWRVWRRAVADTSVDRAIASLYAELDREIAARRPTCWISGRCCNFEAFGHKLYVTGLEIAWFLSKLCGSVPQATVPVRAPQESWQARLEPAGVCPFQINKLCSVHAVRPLGCRIFFCQDGTDVWQHELYEQFLLRLRRLHDERRLPYCYMEWRMGLAEALKCAE